MLLLPVLFFACGGPPPLECTAALEPLEPTIPHITWTAEEPATVHVDYGLGELDRHTAEMEVEGGDVGILLPGFTANQDVRFEAVSVTDAGTSTCVGTIRTGVPSCALTLSIPVNETRDPPPFQYLMGTACQMTGGGIVFITDRAGKMTWCTAYEGPYSAFDAFFATNGGGILASRFHTDHSIDAGAILRFGLDGQQTDEVAIPLGHHFFTELPPDAPDGAAGTFAYLAIDARSWTDPDSGEILDVVGDALMEVAPDGSLRTVLSTWDILPVTKGVLWNQGFYAQGMDWTHANSIHYNPGTDHYLMSLGGIDVILEIDRRTATVARSFGQAGLLEGMYDIADGSTPFHTQHEVDLTEAGEIRLFTTLPEADGGLRYAVDDENLSLRETAAVGFDLGYESFALGQYLPLDDGGALLNYATAGMIVQLDADGNIVWQAETEIGYFLGDVHPYQVFPSLETP